MNFGALVITLSKLEDENGHPVLYGRNIMANELLKAAGIISTKLPKPESMKKWIAGQIPKNPSTYFPDGKVKDVQVFNFFKAKIGRNNWRRLQHNISELEDPGVVDCSTESADIFYQSLVIAFILSLGIKPEEQYQDIPLSDTLPIQQMRQVFEQASKSYGIEGFIKSEPTHYDEMLKEATHEIYEMSTGYPSPLIGFDMALQSEIVKHFEHHAGEVVYVNILRFLSILKKYDHLLEGYPPKSTGRFIQDSPQTERYRKRVEQHRQQLLDLYEEICNSNQ